MTFKVPLRSLLSMALAASLPAYATDGYFANGYGVAAQGVAGVAIALPQDGLAAANNPAGTAYVGDRIDLGASIFLPRRGGAIVGNAFAADNEFSGDGKKTFVIPEFGYTRQLGADWAAGVAVYGNGGLNTEYSENPYARFGSRGTAGVDLAQLFITPSLAYRFAEDQVIGVGLNFAYQRFKATGLGAFATSQAPGPFSVDPSRLTDQGYSAASGWGLRIGWSGALSSTLKAGVSYATKTRVGEFERYRGLFADGGDFDIPANYGVGLAWEVSPALTLAADWKRIEYSGVGSVGNSLSRLLAGRPLGADCGPGFGWEDISILKVGALWRASEQLTLRIGASHGDQPIPEGETFFNLLAPGVVRNHLSLGATWTHPSGGAWTLAYTHAFRSEVNGTGSIPPGFPPAGFGGGNADIYMHQNVLSLSYGWTL